MKATLHSFLFLLLVFQLSFGQGQTQLGSWKAHLPNSSFRSVSQHGSKIYAAGNGSFMSYDLETGTVKTLSKVDGFTQTEVSYLSENKATGTLVIAYNNGQVDLLKDGKISLMNDIYKADIIGSKGINHLYFVGNEVYFSTDFGVVVYDLLKRKVRESYTSFDNSDGYKRAFSTAILGDTIFVSTSTGVYKASNLNSTNRYDFSNWSLVPSFTDNDKPPFEHLASFNGELFASRSYYYFIYSAGRFYESGKQSLNDVIFKPDYGGLFRGFAYSDNKLWILREERVFSYDGTNAKMETTNNIYYPKDAIKDSKGNVWVASDNVGLFSNLNDKSLFQKIGNNGPNFLSAFSLTKIDGAIYALSGGFNPDYTQYLNSSGFSIYENGLWTSNAENLGNSPKIFDLVDATLNRFDNKIYFSSWANGMMEWNRKDGKENFKILNDTTPGVPLQNCNVGDYCKEPGAPYNRVGGIQVDSKGTIWVINPASDNKGNPMLFSRTLDGTWKSYLWRGVDSWNSFNFTSQATSSKSPAYYVRRIFIDKNDTKWLLSRPGAESDGGLMVFNENRATNPRYLSYSKGVKEEICGKSPNCITADNDGAIWIGTNNGVCYFSDPAEVFANRSVKAAVPVFENRALLNGQDVTAIEVDASNRKWIGTSTSGLWLFNSDGSKQILHFDETNSPLPSKTILDIKVSKSSGEVFVSTDKGMFSYGGNSIEGTEENQYVTIYPNPVTKDFNGFVAIKGLVSNATVKITDISGSLVFQTKAEGSLATWNVRDYNGRRPQPGIYLVFTSKEDGSEALVNKIAIID